MAKCPYCDGVVTFDNIITERPDKGLIKKTTQVMYSCPHCKKILNIGTGL
jgi:uncharacterized protein YlaI